MTVASTVLTADTVPRRQVPMIPNVQKTVEVPQIQYVDKIVDAPGGRDTAIRASGGRARVVLQEEEVRLRE